MVIRGMYVFWVLFLGSLIGQAGYQKAFAEGRLPVVYVDAEEGDDGNSGDSPDAALQTLRAAAQKVQPSGKLNLVSRQTPFRDPLHLTVGGTEEAPLVVEGDGATIDLGTEITAGPWEQDGEFWVFQGTSRPHTRPFQASPIFVDNQPQWVPHEKDTSSTPDGSVRVREDGKFALLFPPGKTPENSRVFLTSTEGESAVFLNQGDHIIVRNLTVRYAGNDGFNVHGSGKGIRFENIRAFMCADQGISSHGTAEVSVDGAEVAFCGSRAGGIADVAQSITTYRNILLHNNRVAGLHLAGAHHDVQNLVVFENQSDALPVAGANTEVANAAALDSSFAIAKTSGPSDPVKLGHLIEKARKASKLTSQVPYPGVMPPGNP